MIRCLIVDDEPIAIRVLEAHLEKIPDVEVAATSSNAVKALRLLRENAIDLVLLDIEMPELSGVEFVESLPRPPAFIFTTAHRDYALRGFELNAVDYLLKPVGFPRLLRAIEKFRRLHGGTTSTPDAPRGTIDVRVDRRTVRIELRDIRYVESMGDYVIIHADAERYTSKLTLSELEEQLTDSGFARIHRSYLVAMGRIDAFTSNEVQIGDAVLPVSRTYRREIAERLSDGSS